MLRDQLMYLPLKFPTSILIKILEELYKNSAVIWVLKNSVDIFSTFPISCIILQKSLFQTGILIKKFLVCQDFGYPKSHLSRFWFIKYFLMNLPLKYFDQNSWRIPQSSDRSHLTAVIWFCDKYFLKSPEDF